MFRDARSEAVEQMREAATTATLNSGRPTALTRRRRDPEVDKAVGIDQKIQDHLQYASIIYTSWCIWRRPFRKAVSGNMML
jgi:hypothetical protein